MSLELDPSLAALSEHANPSQPQPQPQPQPSHMQASASQPQPLYTQEQLDHFARLDVAYAHPPASIPVHSTTAPDPDLAEAAAAVILASAPSTSLVSVEGAPAPATAAASPPTPEPQPQFRPIAPNGQLPEPEPQPSEAGKAVKPTKGLTATEKAANRKERNRLAAQKSREKRQAEYDSVVADRDRWKEEAMQLRARVRQLEALVESTAQHSSSATSPQQLPDEAIPPEDHTGGLS